MILLFLDSGILFNRRFLCYCDEEYVYQAVRISFAAFSSESAVVESSIHQHFPYGWGCPSNLLLIGRNFCPEIVVVASKTYWDSIIIRSGDANQVLFKFFECLVKSLFVILDLTLAVTYQTCTVAKLD